MAVTGISYIQADRRLLAIAAQKVGLVISHTPHTTRRRRRRINTHVRIIGAAKTKTGTAVEAGEEPTPRSQMRLRPF